MLFLLLLLVCAPVVGGRGLRESHRPTAWASGLAISIIIFLLVVNFASHFLVVEVASRWAAGVLVLLSAYLARQVQAPAAGWTLTRATRAYLCLVAGFIYTYTTLAQNISVDDDYWVHAPLMGLLKHELIPPTNPFFRDVTLNGHYGRDLLIASFSSLTGINVLRTQMLLATACSLLAFYLLFAALLRSTRSEMSAVLGSCLVTFGINVGMRPGAIDTLENNNPLVYFLLVLFVFLYHRVSDEQAGPPLLVACGLTLGVLAFSYETHFGLCFLATGTSATLRHLREGGQAWKRSLVVLLIGSAIALTQGGPITQLARRALAGAPTPTTATPAEDGQQQRVSLQFPKDHFLELHLGEGEFRRLSWGYKTFTPLLAWVPIASGSPYAALWSRDVLQIHWLATYLGLFAMIYAWRKRLNAPLFLGIFACFSFLTPAVAGFGKVYEFEYFRWHYAAGLAFAGCLGAALGHVFGRAERGATRAGWGVALALVSFFSIAPFFWLTLPLRVQNARGLSPSWFLVAQPTSEWLRYHCGSLGVLPTDTLMAAALLKKARPGDKVLMNLPVRGQSSILLESTLSGLTSLPFVGHSLPVANEAVETTPYRMAAPARAFWGSLDPLLLSQLGVRWLYLRPGPEFRVETLEILSRIPDLKLQASFQDSNGPYRLYEYSGKTLEATEIEERSASVAVTALLLGDTSLEHSRYYPARMRLRNDGVSTVLAGTLLAYQWSSRPEDRERVLFRLQASLEPDASLTQSVPLVAPHELGKHTLRVYLEASPGSSILRPLVPFPGKISIR